MSIFMLIPKFRVIGSRLLLLLLPALLPACQSGSSTEVTPQGHPALSDKLAELPGPDQILRNGSAVQVLRIREGADMLAEPRQNVGTEGSAAEFSVAAGAEPPPTASLAYAVYQLQLEASPSLQNLYVHWDASALPPAGSVFVALSDWKANRWRWFSLEAGDALDIGNSNNYRATDGRVLVAVLQAASGTAQLDWVRIGENAPPQIVASLTGDGQAAPASINVDATASRDIDGSLVELSWDWLDDGSSELTESQPTAEQREFHLGGEFPLRLRATDDEGLSSELLLTASVPPHSVWWCAGANRYQNRRSTATGPSLLTQDSVLAWNFDTVDGPDGVLVGRDGTIYAASHDGKVFAIDPLDGQEITHYDAGSGIYLRLRAIAPDGSICVLVDNHSPDDTNSLLSLNEDLQENWHITGAQGARDFHGFTMDGGMLVSYADSELRSIDPQSQATNWSYTIPESQQARGIAAVSDDGRIYFGTDKSDCYCLAADGSYIGSATARSTLLSSPVLNSSGNVLLLGKTAGRVIICDHDGLETLNYPIPGSNHPLTLPAIGFELSEEHLLIPVQDKNLYALKMDGELGWTLPGETNALASPVVDADENIYGVQGGGLASYKPNKNPRWNFSIEPPLGGLDLQAMLADGSLLFSSSSDYSIRCYRP